eukprot:TRINITY_DN41751_c1_g2_i1.p1 TRINITY_DN41751_c1_g2~~TRINITY_DN41751_c1_g2_i1.p1  ORF type:complete len:408 (-),score=97.91 TRINITY_DN41751_c1_g2_i1:124-1347(-)
MPLLPERYRGGPPEGGVAEVYAAVYELHGTAAVGLFVGKLYHLAIQVYHLEWSYGGGDYGSGVFPCHPGQCSLGTLQHEIPLGSTPFTPQGALQIIGELRPYWPSNGYDVLHRNCQHFSVKLAQRLEVATVPEWVTSTVYKYGSVTAKHVEPLRLPYAKMEDDELEDLLDTAGDMQTRTCAQIEIVWRQSQSFTLDKHDAALRSARLEELTLELTHPANRDMTRAAGLLSKDTEFKVAVLESVANALKVRTEEDEDHDWLDLLGLQHSSQTCIKAQLRLHSSANAPDDWPPAKPRLREFERLFLRSLNQRMVQLRSQQREKIAAWPQSAFMLVGNLQVRTSPGMRVFGERVEVHCGGKGGAMDAGEEAPPPVYFNTHEDDALTVQAAKKLVSRLQDLCRVVDRRRKM